jgi:hypothetical protein
MKETTLNNVQRINVIVLLVGSLLSLFIMREFRYFFSFAVASAITVLNFKLLRKIIEGALEDTATSKKELLIKLPLKILLFFGLIAVILIFGDVDMVFFMIGLSTVFLSIMINQIADAFFPAMKRRQKDGT